MTRDYGELGFKAGLEIHQQLDTGKLFCRCPAELDETVDATLRRELRPTQSELGEVDPAALAEARKELRFAYDVSQRTACLVEMDEEPPHPLDGEAVDVALTMALLLEMEPVDEVHVMRKIVIDGSNTTGFQRTSLLARGGAIQSQGGPVGVDTLCLEEDAARRVGREGGTVRFRLDRLGIPLVEIATAPDLRDPDHVREVAEGLGRLLRATGRVKRGLGTIRQDLNVSIARGSRVELKGVQTLDILADAARWEVERQLHLLAVRDQLRERGVDGAAVAAAEPVDLTELLEGSDAGPVQRALDAGGHVLALALPGFAGLLGNRAADPDAPRLGRELADHARAAAGVAGLFHSDELPAYGVTAAEVANVREALDLGPDDAFVLVAAPAATARKALAAVADRAGAALAGVPGETRDVREDGTSRYLRPLPGSARMYPETDVPPLPVDADRLARLEADLPELLDEKVERLAREFDLSGEEVQVLVRTGQADLYEELVDATGLERDAATLLVTTLPDLKRAGVPAGALTDALLLAVLRRLASGDFAREAVPEVLEHAARKDVPVDEAVEALGLAAVAEADVDAAIAEVLDANADLVAERGLGAVGPLMGTLMERFRGRVGGEELSRRLREAIQERSG